MLRDPRFPLLLLCFFLSGLTALVYETAWTREFAFVFGTSHLAVATVLAAYMGGLAAGAAAAGRFAHRVRRPVLAYGLLELGVALAALAVPLAIDASRALYVGLFGGQEDLPGGGGLATALFYLASSFLILLVPTAMMGATLPLLARHAVRREEEIGSRTGLLYSTNTAGAVAGCLLAGFVLLPGLGLRQTIWAAALVNGSVFFAAWALARAGGPGATAPAAIGASLGAGTGRWILPLIFASGTVSFTLEVLWVRLLDHLLGGTLYAFSTMLASFLAGIAVGSAIASRLATSPERALRDFSIAQLFIASLSLIAFAAVGWIPGLTRDLGPQEGHRLLRDAVAAMATLFPAAVAVGATFPLAVRALARSETDAGPASARVYAANTLGAIVGAVGAGFFVIPALGYERTLAACAATSLLLAAAAALRLPTRRRALVATVGAGLVLLAAFPPVKPWAVLRASGLTGRLAQGQVEYFGVGRSATVFLQKSRSGWLLRTNGLPESGIDLPGVWRARSGEGRWLTLLPVLARPSARTMLVVGFGGGVLLEAIPSALERIDVVELEPEVLAANRAVAGRRARDPLADPRLHVHLNDARNALLLTDMRFDAIVSQPSHPWSGGAAHLYTREFFELARSRLAADGVLVQWIGFPFVDESLFRSLLATLAEVFRNVRVYAPPPPSSALFIASDGPLDVERSSEQALRAAPGDFAPFGLLVPEDVTASLLLDEAGVRELARGAPPIRDDHNLLQLRSGILEQSLRGRVYELVGGLDPLAKPELVGSHPFYLLRWLPAKRAARVAAALPDPADRQAAEAILATRRDQSQAARARLLEALRQAPEHRPARAELLRLSERRIREGLDAEALVPPPLDEAERAVVEGWRALNADGDARLRALEQALAGVPARHPLAGEASRIRAAWRIASGDPALAREAIPIVDRAIRDLGYPADVLLRAEACMTAGDHAQALHTLSNLAYRLGGARPRGRALAQQGLRIARSVPADPGLDELRAGVEKLLRARLRGGRPQS